MTAQQIFKAAKIGFALLIAGLIYLTVTAEPDKRWFWLELEPTAEQKFPSRVFYLQGKKVAHVDEGIVLRNPAHDSVFVQMPRHVTPDGLFIDLGDAPATWEVNRIYYRSRFLFFLIDSYEWDLSAISELSEPYSNRSELVVDQSLQVTTKAYPYRFYFKLDHAKLQIANQLLIAKLAVVMALIGIYLLLCSKYFWQLFSTRATDSELLATTAKNTWASYKPFIVAGSLALLVVMIYMGHESIAHPGLYIEDSMELTDALAGNLGIFDAESYHYYRGYKVFLSELMVNATDLLPLQWQPVVYVIIGLLFAWFALSFMASSGIIRHPFVLLIAPLALFIGSFNIPAFFLTLTGTFFSSTALMMGLVVRRPRQNWTLFAASLVLLCALAWSGPYAPQVLPLAFVLLCFVSAGKKTALLVTSIVVSLLYTRSSASGMVQLENLLDPAIQAHFYDSLVTHIFTFGFLEQPDFRVGLGFLAAIIAALVVFRSDRLYVKHSLAFLGTTLASLLTYFISFKYHQYQGELISAHWVIAQFTWMVFLVMTLDQLLLRLPGSKSVAVTAVVVIAALGSLLYVKEKNESPREILYPDYDLPLFLEAVEFADQLSLDSNQFVQLWDVNHHGYITSYKLGAAGKAAVSIDASVFPERLRKFVLPVDLERRDNMLMQLWKNSTIWYSDQTFKELPKELTIEHRKAIKLR